MSDLPTPADNRDTKRADQLRPGDWIRPGYLIGGDAVARVELVRPYLSPVGKYPKALVVAWDPDAERPETARYDADDMVTLALPDEIPEDPNASGRDISEPDEAAPIPPGVYGEHEGAPAGRTVDGA